MDRIKKDLRRWLSTDDLPADIYQLLGLLRFAPLEQCVEQVPVRYAVLLPYQNHSDPAIVRRAVRLQMELGRAADLIAHPDRLKAHHDEMLQQMRAAYEAERGDRPGSMRELEAWLKARQRVLPARAGEIAEVLLDLWDRPPDARLAMEALPRAAPLEAAACVAPSPVPEQDGTTVPVFEAAPSARQATPRRRPRALKSDFGRVLSWRATLPLALGLLAVLIMCVGLWMSGEKRRVIKRPPGFAPAPISSLQGADGGATPRATAPVEGLATEGAGPAAGPTLAPKPEPRPVRYSGVLEEIRGFQGEVHLLLSGSDPGSASAAPAKVEFYTRLAAIALPLEDYLSHADRGYLPGDQQQAFRPDWVLVEGEPEADPAPVFRLEAGIPLFALKSITRVRDPSATANRNAAERRSARALLSDLARCQRIQPLPDLPFELTARCDCYTAATGQMTIRPIDAEQPLLTVCLTEGTGPGVFYAPGKIVRLQVWATRASTFRQLELAGVRVGPARVLATAPAKPSRFNSEAVAERLRWQGLLWNPELHVGERQQGTGTFEGIDEGPPRMLRLTVAGCLVEVPWRPTPAREQFLRKIQPKEAVAFELIIQGRLRSGRTAPKVGLFWIARQALPDEKLALNPDEWQHLAGAELAVIAAGFSSSVTSVAWNCDGRYLAAASAWDASSAVKVFDAVSGALVDSASSPPADAEYERRIVDFAWHPSRNQMVVAAHGAAWLWAPDSQGAAPIKVRMPQADEFFSIDWCSDGTHVAMAWRASLGPSGVTIANPSTGERRLTSPLARGSLVVRAARKGTRLVAVGEQTTANVALLSTQKTRRPILLEKSSEQRAGSKELQTASRSGLTLQGLAWSPASPLLAVADKTLKVWDLSRAPARKQEFSLEGSSPCISWSPDGLFLAASTRTDGIRVWNVETGALAAKFAEDDIIYSIAWSPPGGDGSTARLAAGDARGNVHIYRAMDDPVDAEKPEAIRAREREPAQSSGSSTGRSSSSSSSAAGGMGGGRWG